MYQDNPVLTTKDFPDDLDTTSLALLNVGLDRKIVSSIMDEMLECVNEDGIAQV